MKSRGCVIGAVSKVEINNSGGQNVEAIVDTSQGLIRGERIESWHLQASAKSIQHGDIICLLQGSTKSTIIRPRERRFTVIMIAALPPMRIHTNTRNVEWRELVQSASFIRDFLLVWDWETTFENVWDPVLNDALMRTDSESKLSNPIQIWNFAQILGDAGEFNEAEKIKQKATESFQVVLGEEHIHSLECQCSQVPLLWAAEGGYDAVVCLLLARDGVDQELVDYCGRDALSLATENGHEAVVKLLFKTSKASVNSKDKKGRTPLSWAARNGYRDVVNLLLETINTSVDPKDKDGRTPLSWATENGHDAVVKLLLKTGKVNINLKDNYHDGRTPLSWAAGNGYEAVVKLLLGSSNVDVNLKDDYHDCRTPPSWAAGNGHEAVVKLLLETDKVDVDLKDNYNNGRTPLSWAAGNGLRMGTRL